MCLDWEIPDLKDFCKHRFDNSQEKRRSGIHIETGLNLFEKDICVIYPLIRRIFNEPFQPNLVQTELHKMEIWSTDKGHVIWLKSPKQPLKRLKDYFVKFNLVLMLWCFWLADQ